MKKFIIILLLTMLVGCNEKSIITINLKDTVLTDSHKLNSSLKEYAYNELCEYEIIIDDDNLLPIEFLEVLKNKDFKDITISDSTNSVTFNPQNLEFNNDLLHISRYVDRDKFFKEPKLNEDMMVPKFEVYIKEVVDDGYIVLSNDSNLPTDKDIHLTIDNKDFKCGDIVVAYMYESKELFDLNNSESKCFKMIKSASSRHNYKWNLNDLLIKFIEYNTDKHIEINVDENTEFLSLEALGFYENTIEEFTINYRSESVTFSTDYFKSKGKYYHSELYLPKIIKDKEINDNSFVRVTHGIVKELDDEKLKITVEEKDSSLYGYNDYIYYKEIDECVEVGSDVVIHYFIDESTKEVKASGVFENALGALKPVIYLYPEEEIEVNVKLDYNGKLSVTYPLYEDGWQVIARPDSTLINLKDNKEYSYLFWEGIDYFNYEINEGFVVRRDDALKFLQDKLSEIGLLPKEYNEMIVYWLPIMLENEYNLVSFMNNEYTDNAVLDIEPEPDSILRVFMVVKKIDEPINIKPQIFSPFIRDGFSVVEWGGRYID